MDENTKQKYPVVNKLVQRVIKKFQLEDYHIETDDSAATANGYLGVIFFVQVTHRKGTLHLVVKAGTQNKNQRNFINVGEIFVREVFFYKEIFPAMLEFQKERLVSHPFLGVAKCYDAYLGTDSEGFVLENLKAKGFRLWNRLIPMDENHVKLVLQEYGRFHALSVAMKDQNPQKFKQLTHNYDDTFKEFLKSTNSVENYRARFGILADLLRKQGRSDVAEKVKKFLSEIEDFMMNCSGATDPHSVILHGDCWCNNIMFKYEVNQFSM